MRASFMRDFRKIATLTMNNEHQLEMLLSVEMNEVGVGVVEMKSLPWKEREKFEFWDSFSISLFFFGTGILDFGFS
jgi:hypothetical protein